MVLAELTTILKMQTLSEKRQLEEKNNKENYDIKKEHEKRLHEKQVAILLKSGLRL